MTIHRFRTDDEVVKFARSWLWGLSRFVGKNVRCCLTATEKGEVAWFPALMESCAFLDLLATLYRGVKFAKVKDVQAYAARFLDPEHYPSYELEILWAGFRHKIAHQAHPNYVLDTKRENIKGRRRRIVWSVVSEDLKPALRLVNVDERDSLSSPNPMVPWPVPYGYRITISPLRLQIDLRNSMYGPKGYLKWLEGNPAGRWDFAEAMLRFFPPKPTLPR